MHSQIILQPTTAPFAFNDSALNTDIPLIGRPIQFADRLNALRNIEMALPENIKREIEKQSVQSAEKLQDLDDSIVYGAAYRRGGRAVSQADSETRLAHLDFSGTPRLLFYGQQQPPTLPLPLRPAIPSGLGKLDKYLKHKNKDSNNALIFLSQFKTKPSYVTIRQLLRAKTVDPNFRNKNQDTALHYAIANNAFGKASLLLHFNADANAKGMYGQTPIMLATLINDSEVIFMLVKYGADVNAADNSGNTALHLSILYDRPAAFYQLMKYEPDLSLCNKNKENPLSVAIKYGFYEFLKELIKAGADIDDFAVDGLKPLAFAIIDNDLILLKILLEGKANVDIFDPQGNNSLLALADEHNFPQGSELLAQFGARHPDRPAEVVPVTLINPDNITSTTLPGSVAEPATLSASLVTDPAVTTITEAGQRASTTPATSGTEGNITKAPAIAVAATNIAAARAANILFAATAPVLDSPTAAITPAKVDDATGRASTPASRPVSLPGPSSTVQTATSIGPPLANTTHATSPRPAYVTQKSLSSPAARPVNIIGQTFRWITSLVGATGFSVRVGGVTGPGIMAGPETRRLS